MPMFRFFIHCSLALTTGLGALQAGLVNGPMLAHVEMREAKVWVQTDAPALVRVAYAPGGADETLRWSAPVETQTALGHTAVATLDQVEPGRTYSYRVELDGELVSSPATFATPGNYFDRSPPPDFKFAAVGAHYVNDGC